MVHSLVCFLGLLAAARALPQESDIARQAVRDDYKLSNNLRGLGDAYWNYLHNKTSSDGCESFGCWKNYCWAKCGLAPKSKGEWRKGEEWCYTTTSYSQSFAYVTCLEKSECSGCWNCAGACTL